MSQLHKACSVCKKELGYAYYTYTPYTTILCILCTYIVSIAKMLVVMIVTYNIHVHSAQYNSERFHGVALLV